MTAIATTLGALVALIGVPFALWRYRGDRRAARAQLAGEARAARERLAKEATVARERLTFESIARLEDLGIEYQAMMASFLRGGLRPPGVQEADWDELNEPARLATRMDTWKHLNGSPAFEDRETLLQILAYPNLLEGIASMYNHGLLDPGIVKTRIEARADSFWTLGEWWVKEIRLLYKNDALYVDLEAMLKTLKEQKRPSPYERDK